MIAQRLIANELVMDFTSQFWAYFIAAVTIASLAYVVLLAFFNRKTSSGANETTGHVWDEDLTEYDNPLPAWWLYLLYITVIFGIVYLILYPGLLPNGGLFNWSQVGQYEAELETAEQTYAATFDAYAQAPVTELASNEQAMKTAARLFTQNCALCHGNDARGAPGIPNLRDDDWIFGDSSDVILKTILQGRVAVMPGWEAVLGGPEAVADVANFVLQLSGEVVNVESAKRGQAKYATVCVACHGANGGGNQLLGGVNLTDQIWLHGGSFETVSDIIANGISNNMPAHEPILGETKSKLLAAYVLSLNN